MLPWLVPEDVLVFLNALKIVSEDVIVFINNTFLKHLLFLDHHSLSPYTDRIKSQIFQPHFGQGSLPSLSLNNVLKFTHPST